ncbi:FAS1 domain protein [Cordyceps fumosorosea ARSEF 2679]|uniref:FAS1 domain protein n=1 Tax=Cordyceps fumosorosea (strain ARSEF 2679) TaxID=1081104 RepID=A0A167V6H6_CORFA|nr:FAS1 domain protein [Cordyceps fumosorosea ARSEF 2679]OAA62279.1 FAS1 domain protein [Cordyceps fumosorosea ARSEF 2679]
MRSSVIAILSCFILLTTVAATLRRSPRPNNDVTIAAPAQPARLPPQRLLTMPGDGNDGHPVQLAVRLSDTLGSNRALSTFSSFARRDAAADERLASDVARTTVLAPLNSAVEALPRKPWEKEGDGGASTYEGPDGKDRADANLDRFVEAHMVTRSPWPAGERAKTMAGTEVWWEERGDGKRVVMPDEVEVDKVAIEVGNGQLWIIKAVLKFE